MGTPGILRIANKYYGGIHFFDNKPISLLVACLKHGLEKDNELPKIIGMFFEAITGKQLQGEINYQKKSMRNKEDILKDYGLSDIKL